MNANVSDLIGPSSSPSSSTQALSAEEYTRQAYLEDLARFRDFRPATVLWPDPIRPRWRN